MPIVTFRLSQEHFDLLRKKGVNVRKLVEAFLTEGSNTPTVPSVAPKVPPARITPSAPPRKL